MTLYCCSHCRDFSHATSEVKKHYRKHVPRTQKQYTCMYSSCSWFGDYTSDYNNHTVSTRHQYSKTQSTVLQPDAVKLNPDRLVVTDELAVVRVEKEDGELSSGESVRVVLGS